MAQWEHPTASTNKPHTNTKRTLFQVTLHQTSINHVSPKVFAYRGDLVSGCIISIKDMREDFRNITGSCVSLWSPHSALHVASHHLMMKLTLLFRAYRLQCSAELIIYNMKSREYSRSEMKLTEHGRTEREALLEIRNLSASSAPRSAPWICQCTAQL